MMKEPQHDDPKSAMLDALLGAWAQAHELPPSHAAQIRIVARQSTPPTILPRAWWSDFSRDLTAIVSHASRTWSGHQPSL
jgi:hypothetical protein